jgi:hypothetical protein
VLDKFLAEIDKRLEENSLVIMEGVSSCTPSSSAFLSVNKLKSFADAYSINTATLEVECHVLGNLMKQLSQNKKVNSLASFGCFLLSRQPAHSTILS